MDIRILDVITRQLGSQAMAARERYGGADMYTQYATGGGIFTNKKQYAETNMTISSCLRYCSTADKGSRMQYAGLENGRECWCGRALSDLSERLHESSKCVTPCRGNASEVCGGPLALTLYNLTSLESQTGTAWSQQHAAAGYGTLAVILLIIAAFL